jgi:hypothetical protein
VADTEDIRLDRMFESFIGGSHQGIEDSLHGLRFPLQRLVLVGLTERDVKELTDLGQAVIQEKNVGEAAKRIGDRREASPLAVVIAVIVRNAEKRDAREVMLGAIFGAFVGLETRRPREAVLGAVGGALAATNSQALQKRLKGAGISWQEWAGLG